MLIFKKGGAKEIVQTLGLKENCKHKNLNPQKVFSLTVYEIVLIRFLFLNFMDSYRYGLIDSYTIPSTINENELSIFNHWYFKVITMESWYSQDKTNHLSSRALQCFLQH